MEKFDVAVSFTDRSRIGTKYREFPAYVEILAENANEATLLAAQMVACVIGDGMVLATDLIE